MKILVTGSRGFIGQAVGRAAARRGDTVAGLSRSAQAARDWPGRHYCVDVIDDDMQLKAFLASHPLHQIYGGEHAYPLGGYESAFGAAGLTLTRVYGPLDSMVNFYPGSRARRIAKVALRMTSREPGRLYSFLAERR